MLHSRKDFIERPPPHHERHKPETTLLYQIVEEYWPSFQTELDRQGKSLPHFVANEFDEYLKCGKLEHGFLRVHCSSCRDEKLVAFSCKKRGICPSCGARRMADSAALLVDDVLPHQPIRQWVLSFPFQLRFLLANNPQVMGKVLGIVTRAISTHLIKKAGYKKSTTKTGSVTLIQRFGRSGVPAALNPDAAHSICISTSYSLTEFSSRKRTTDWHFIESRDPVPMS
jgi:ribosomal protein S27E